MSVIARQSTARTVMVGPILDAAGAAVTGAAVGDLKISKNGGAPAALNGSATLTHRHTGHYSLALTASDLDTVGQAEVVIDRTTDAMPTKVVTVIEEAVYDALFASSASGYSTYAGGAVASVTGDVGGNVVGSVGSVTGLTASDVGAIKAKTDNLPSDPADQSLIIAATDAITTAVGTRASQASADDLPTNAELSTALASADDATLSAIAALNNLSAAQVRTELATELGRLDVAVSTRATPADVAAELGTYDSPTKAELDAAVATLATDANLAAAQVVLDAIQAKTDLIPTDPAETSDIPSAATVAAAVLTAAASTPIAANAKQINDVTLQGNGSSTPWGPA